MGLRSWGDLSHAKPLSVVEIETPPMPINAVFGGCWYGDAGLRLADTFVRKGATANWPNGALLSTTTVLAVATLVVLTLKGEVVGHLWPWKTTARLGRPRDETSPGGSQHLTTGRAKCRALTLSILKAGFVPARRRNRAVCTRPWRPDVAMGETWRGPC